jgi:O-antigen/teichoic acid export membrane protein
MAQYAKERDMPEPQLITTNPPPTGSGDVTPLVSLRTLAVRGTLWTILGFGSSQVLRLAFNLVLARLLVPEFFGLMALVWTIATGVNLFFDLGVSPAVVRDPRGDTPEFLNTAWALQIVRGVGLALLCFLLAPLMAAFYGDPRLRWILPLIGTTSVASGFASTSLITLQRHMVVKRVVIMDVVTQAVSGVLMVSWALLRPSVWALVCGSMAPSVLKMVWSHFLVPGRSDRIAWDRTAVRTLFVFGRWVWMSSILTFLASQIDRLILGKLFTLQMLGVYSIATMIAEVPRALVMAMIRNVIFPAYSKSAEFPRPELREKVLRYRRTLLAVMACGIAALVAGGDVLIGVLYDKRYAAGSWMLPILALGLWPSLLAKTIDSSLAAIGKPRYAAFGDLFKVLFTAIGIPLGFSMGGPAGAVIMVALNDIPYYGQIAHGLWREGLNSFAQDLKATAFLAALLSAALAARLLFGIGMPIHP